MEGKALDTGGSTTQIGRRAVLGAFGGAFGAAALAGCAPGKRNAASDRDDMAPRFIDLTHPLTTSFAFGSPPRWSLEPIDGSGKDHGMLLLNRVSLVEHTGTHIDVPRHFGADRPDLAELALEDLIVPLAVIDVREQATATNNFSLLPEHILAWEEEHGRLPERGCLALWSGFDPAVFLESIRTGGGRPESGIPGFAPEAVAWLLENRSLKGIAVDSMTLDSGDYTPEYPAHNAWLQGSRWGLEMLANLGDVPTTGATIIVGAVPLEGATGFPVRAIAML